MAARRLVVGNAETRCHPDLSGCDGLYPCAPAGKEFPAYALLREPLAGRKNGPRFVGKFTQPVAIFSPRGFTAIPQCGYSASELEKSAIARQVRFDTR
jgi:hypothetical protein